VVIVFLDTNTLLHYRSIDEVDWCEILADQEVEIVIPASTVTELDRQKFAHHLSKFRRRAGSVVARLQRLSEQASPVRLREGVTLTFEILSAAPPRTARKEFTPDDELIESALRWPRMTPGTSIVIVTADLGLRLKARQREIQVISLSDDLKLRDELDASELRIRDLEHRVAELSNSVPRPRMGFADGKAFVTFDLGASTPLSEGGVEAQIEIFQREYPPWNRIVNETIVGHGGFGWVASVAGIEIDSKDGERYNRDRKTAIASLREYYGELAVYEATNDRTIELNLVVLNEGTAPADDIDVLLYFPDGCRLFGEDERPRPPVKPKPPARPRTSIELLQPLVPSDFGDFELLRAAPYSGVQHNVSTNTIRESNSYEVSAHIRRVKHGQNERLDDLWLVFDSFDTVQSFGVQYELHTANVPAPTKGVLNVVINRQ